MNTPFYSLLTQYVTGTASDRHAPLAKSEQAPSGSLALIISYAGNKVGYNIENTFLLIILTRPGFPNTIANHIRHMQKILRLHQRNTL